MAFASDTPFSLKSTGQSGHQYHAVIPSTSTAAESFALVGVRGAKSVGIVLDNSTEASDQAIQLMGVAKIAAGDSSEMANAINLGTVVVASSKGQAVPSTAVDLYALGISLGTLSTGSTGVIPVALTIGARTTA